MDEENKFNEMMEPLMKGSNDTKEDKPMKPHRKKINKVHLTIHFCVALVLSTVTANVVPFQDLFVAQTILGFLVIETRVENLKVGVLFAVGLACFAIWASVNFYRCIWRWRMLYDWRTPLADPEKKWWFSWVTTAYGGSIGFEIFYFLKRLQLAAVGGYGGEKTGNFEAFAVSAAIIFFTGLIGSMTARAELEEERSNKHDDN